MVLSLPGSALGPDCSGWLDEGASCAAGFQTEKARGLGRSLGTRKGGSGSCSPGVSGWELMITGRKRRPCM